MYIMYIEWLYNLYEYNTLIINIYYIYIKNVPVSGKYNLVTLVYGQV